jgi:hypothetical protein
VYIDESTDEAQREALGKILSGEAGGPVFEILSSIVTTVHGRTTCRSSGSSNQEGRTARLAFADHFETESRPRSAGETARRAGQRSAKVGEVQDGAIEGSHGSRAHVAAER